MKLRDASTRPRRSVISALSAIVLSVLVFTLPGFTAETALAQSDSKLDELQRKREQLRAEKADNASQIDTLQASDAEITQALADLNANVAGLATMLEESRREVEAAEAQEQRAVDAEIATQRELDGLRASMKQQAIREYTRTGNDEMIDLLSADTANQDSVRRTLFEAHFQRSADATERYRVLQDQLSEATATASNARSRAQKKRAEVTERLRQITAAQDQQEKFQAQVDARLDRALGEAAALQSSDAALSAEITQRQAEIAAEIERKRQEAAAAAARAAAAGASARNRSTTSIPIPQGGAGIVTVRGIRVHSSIASNLDAMLGAAEADGIHMSGGGYRDPADQIAVRRANGCPDIYNSPASACHPPTARPGHSMHERGLAIDFSQNGSSLSRSSSGFQWLKAHAAQYGFYNLPSEPWHWSTNGN